MLVMREKFSTKVTTALDGHHPESTLAETIETEQAEVIGGPKTGLRVQRSGSGANQRARLSLLSR